MARAEAECALGVRSATESRGRQAIASGEGELEREVEQRRGVKGRDPDTCSYLNLQLLAEVTTVALRREALFFALGYELPASVVRSS